MTDRYQVRTPTVIHEVFDDEVVIVNLDSGDYYSLSKAGSDCWHHLLSGCSVDEIIAAVEAKYEGDPTAIRDSVISLIRDLVEETLIVPHPNAGHGGASSADSDPVEAGKKIPFYPPALNRYSDMRDLLLIDPIHDVDESGWPQTKNDSKEPTEE